jgi:hypothetical protein
LSVNCGRKRFIKLAPERQDQRAERRDPEAESHDREARVEDQDPGDQESRARDPPHAQQQQQQESILQNSVSAENFTSKFSSSNFGQMPTQKQI